MAMDGFSSVRTKRKDLYDKIDCVSDEFSDFNLSAPARKSRRLDADLIGMDVGSTSYCPQGLPEHHMEVNVDLEPPAATIVEEVPPVVNEERSLVLYKGVNSPSFPLLRPVHSGLSFNEGFMVDFKSKHSYQFLKVGASSGSSVPVMREDGDDSLALVPWVPSHSLATDETGNDVVEVIESEPMEVESMQIDSEEHLKQDRPHVPQVSQIQSSNLEAGLQWQHHCVAPHPPSSSSPVMWSW